jgi:hypothetical protein
MITHGEMFEGRIQSGRAGLQASVQSGRAGLQASVQSGRAGLQASVQPGRAGLQASVQPGRAGLQASVQPVPKDRGASAPQEVPPAEAGTEFMEDGDASLKAGSTRPGQRNV